MDDSQLRNVQRGIAFAWFTMITIATIVTIIRFCKNKIDKSATYQDEKKQGNQESGENMQNNAEATSSEEETSKLDLITKHLKRMR